MNKVKTVMVLVATAIITVAGFLLPSFTASVQDQGATDRQKQFETHRVRLDLEPTHDIADVLRLISKGYSTSELTEGRRLTSETVSLPIYELFGLLAANGFEEFEGDSYVVKETIPFLAFNNEEGRAFVLWNCIFVDQVNSENTIYMQIDDETGRVVSFNSIRNYSASEAPDDTEYAYERLVSFSKIWEDHYGIEDVSYSNDDQASSSFSLGNNEGPGFGADIIATMRGGGIQLHMTHQIIAQLDDDYRISNTDESVAERPQVHAVISSFSMYPYSPASS